MSREPAAFCGPGMPEGAEALHLALLDRGTATTADLAGDTGRTPVSTSRLLEWLRSRGLVLRANVLARAGDAEAGWTTADPDRAVRALVLRQESELLRIRGSLPHLHERYLRSRHTEDSGALFEQLDTWEDVGHRYHRLLRQARDEVLTWDTAPYVTGEIGSMEQAALDHGVTFRQLCDPSGLPSEVSSDRSSIDGLKARVHPDLPSRGAIAGRSAAVVTLDHRPQNVTALLVQPSPLLDGLVMLFEHTWSRAVPLGGEAAEPGLTGEEREVMTLLAAGMKDETIARQRGITTRTVRRRVKAVVTVLQAKNRFHAGVEAARRGWG